ncbi:MAG TPA: hypothetical protein VNI84_19315 [Pyrinomonadaceae bacterium]|nr:hypothetical protein [Pyrinomonadaceae bacterium]
MKNVFIVEKSKCSLITGKSFAFLLLLSLSAICSHAVSAQRRKPERIFSAESPSKTTKSEPETEIVPVSEKGGIDQPTKLPNAGRKNDEDEKKVDGRIENAENKSESSDANYETKINEFAYRFRLNGGRQKQLEVTDLPNIEKKTFSFRPASADAFGIDDTKKAASPDDSTNGKAEGFRWRSAIGQSLMFLAIQHGYAVTQPKTREALKGKFWKDYVKSVKSLRGFDDGGRFFTNYIAHPMQGAFTGFIYLQNDPKGLKQQFGASGDYWRSRMKAMAWSAAWSTQFEIGPVSQASIGNVGLKGKQTWGDIVVTPTVGTAMLIGEDAVDRFIMKWIERRTDNFYVRIFSRMLLSPTRTVANVFRFKTPWYRDRPMAR